MPGNTKYLIHLAVLAVLTVPVIAFAADEPLIPVALNEILPKIRVGMNHGQVIMQIIKKFPAIRATQGAWSGETGYMVFMLNDRYKLSISATSAQHDNETAIVNNDPILYIDDLTNNQRIEMTLYNWQRLKTDSSPGAPAKTPANAPAAGFNDNL